jgi:hypothetical protein
MLGAGAGRIGVRAFAPWRREQRASSGYRLQDATPRAPRIDAMGFWLDERRTFAFLRRD